MGICTLKGITDNLKLIQVFYLTSQITLVKDYYETCKGLILWKQYVAAKNTQ